MSSLKKIKNPRLIKTMTELKILKHATEEINKIKELETEIITESTKRKLSTIEREKEKNELEEETEIKVKITFEKRESQLEILRKATEKKSREFNIDRKIKKKKKEMEKLIIAEINREA